MEIWRILLLILVIALLSALVYALYSTFKYRQIADTQAFEKPSRFIDQSQNSFLISSNHQPKKPSNGQKDFIDSFIDMSKEPSTRNAIASTTHILDKPKGKEENEGLPKSDRSIDFLMGLNTTRRGFLTGAKMANNPDHTQLDMSFTKPKNESEKAQYDIREEVYQIEREVASLSRMELFKSHIRSELMHYHYALAFFSSTERKKPIRHHILYNSSLYLIVLFVLSLLAPGLGPNSLSNFSLVMFGCLVLGVLFLLVVYSLQNTKDECLSSELLIEQRLGEDPQEERANIFLLILQQRFNKEIASKLICILGLAAGFSMFSRIGTMDAVVTEPLFGGFMVVVVFDIAIVRNLLIVALTGSLVSVIRKRVLKERIKQLIETKFAQTSMMPATAAQKNLFTLQQDPKENHKTLESNIKAPKRKVSEKKGEEPQATNRVTVDNEVTGSNEQEETEDRRNRIMSFSEKERHEFTNPSDDIHGEENGSRHRDSPPKEQLQLHQSYSTPTTKNPSSSRDPLSKFSINIPGHDFLLEADAMKQKIVDIITPSETGDLDHASHKDERMISRGSMESNEPKLKRINTGKEKLEYHDDHTHVRKQDIIYETNSTAKKKPEFVPEISEDVELEKPRQIKEIQRKVKASPLEFVAQVEAALNESVEKKHMLNKEDPLASKQQEPKEIDRNEQLKDESQPEIDNKEIAPSSDKAQDMISAKKNLAAFKADWFESLSLEKKQELLMPNQAVGSTLSRDQSRKAQAHYESRGSRGNPSDISASLPHSLAYLDHEKSMHHAESHHEQSKFALPSNIHSKPLTRKESLLSQEEFRNDVENFIKNFPNTTAKKHENMTDSENEDGSHNNEFNLSFQESDLKRVCKESSLREGRLALQERKNRPSPRNLNNDLDDLEDIKRDEWLGYDTQLVKRNRRQINRHQMSYEDRKAKLMQEELEKKRKRRMANPSKEMLVPTVNMDKLSEISRSYGFKIQQRGMSNQDLIISKLEQKRKSASVERPEDEAFESQKLPRVTKSSFMNSRRVSMEEKRTAKSLNKLSSLPEIKEYKAN